MADPKQLATLLKGEPRFGALAALCDEYTASERLLATRSLGAADMAKLYATAENPEGKAELDYLLDPSAPAGTPLAWNGKNSLPLFNLFAKIFARLPDGTMIGRNHGSMEWLIGPGYYTATVHAAHPGQFLVDYTHEPVESVAGWPKIKKNKSGVSTLVFGGMHDYLRPVGKNVAIGAAYDGATGKPKGQYFVLARGTSPEPD